MNQTTIFAGGALFSGEGKLLLLRPISDESRTLLVLPGGELEFGEPPELGLVRCFNESAGLDISVDRPLGAWSEVLQSGGNAVHALHIEYTVRSSGAITSVEFDPGNYSGFTWLTQAAAEAALKAQEIRPSVLGAFALLAKTRGSKA